jgi:hypothetical protein
LKPLCRKTLSAFKKVFEFINNFYVTTRFFFLENV